MDDDFGFREMIDIIFCRNVIIYFDRPTQTRLLNKFCRQMVPGGTCSWVTPRRSTGWMCRLFR